MSIAKDNSCLLTEKLKALKLPKVPHPHINKIKKNKLMIKVNFHKFSIDRIYGLQISYIKPAMHWQGKVQKHN